jgi:hypothetical protein
MKKIQESKKSGAGVDNIYESNIQWLKELQTVYRDADSCPDSLKRVDAYSVKIAARRSR